LRTVRTMESSFVASKDPHDGVTAVISSKIPRGFYQKDGNTGPDMGRA